MYYIPTDESRIINRIPAVSTVFFLYHLASGYDYNHVMKLYTDDYIKNDKMVSLFVKRLRPYVCNDKMFSCVHCVQTCLTYK